MPHRPICILLICRVYLWAGPLELLSVLLMVSLVLGFVPALAGCAATLLIIPIQVEIDGLRVRSLARKGSGP